MNNIYANNFEFYSGLNNKIIEKQKKLLTKLSNSLKDNQWIKISTINFTKQKYNFMLYRQKLVIKNRLYINFKPPGSLWFSKGEWLFHIIGCNKYSRITLVEIDYNNIYRITNKNPDNFIIDTYYKKNLSLFIKNNQVIKKYSNSILKNLILINWKNIIKNYYGFAIYPFPVVSHKLKTGNVSFLNTFDVSSLCLWNTDSIIKSYNLGKISQYIKINNSNTSNTDRLIIQHTRFINNLVKQINKINNI